MLDPVRNDLIATIKEIATGLYDRAPQEATLAEIIERAGLIVELSDKMLSASEVR